MMKRGIAAVALTVGALGLGALGPGVGIASADAAVPLAPTDSDSVGGDFNWRDYANPDTVAALGDLGDLQGVDLTNVGRLGELADLGDLGDLSSLSDLDGNLASISELAGLVHAGG